MIKVAMVVFSSYPEDVRVRREAEALADAGMFVDVVCLKGDNEKKFEKVHGVEIYRLNLKRRRAGKLRYFIEYGYFLLAAFVILSFLHIRKKYCIIHVHNLPDILVLSALLPKITGAKIILDMHEIMPEFFMRKYEKDEACKSIQFIKLMEKTSIKLSNHIIVATPFLKKTIVKRSASPDRCTTILNLPDPKYFHSKVVEIPRLENKFRLIYPGTISEVHGIDIAIKAIKLVTHETNIPIEFNIYGHGSEQVISELKSLINKTNLDGFVKLKNVVSVEKLPEILKSMDVGIVPKRDGMFAGDAISTKLFDFAAIGLPAIVSRTRGDSLFFDDSMVLFFEPENERQLADAIIKLFHNPELRKSLSEKLQLLHKKVNWGVMKKDLYEIYDNLLPGPKNFHNSSKGLKDGIND